MAQYTLRTKDAWGTDKESLCHSMMMIFSHLPYLGPSAAPVNITSIAGKIQFVLELPAQPTVDQLNHYNLDLI